MQKRPLLESGVFFCAKKQLPPIKERAVYSIGRAIVRGNKVNCATMRMSASVLLQERGFPHLLILFVCLCLFYFSSRLNPTTLFEYLQDILVLNFSSFTVLERQVICVKAD